MPSIQKYQYLNYFGVKLAVFLSLSPPLCCLVFQGAIRHLLLTPKELHQYLTQTERLLQRYTQRLRWLLSGLRLIHRPLTFLLHVATLK